MADTSTRIFRASLRGRLYRDIELPSSGSLEDLAAAIVNAFGFDHAFGFYSNLKGDYYRSEERYELFADRKRWRTRVPGGSRAHPGNVGSELCNRTRESRVRDRGCGCGCADQSLELAGEVLASDPLQRPGELIITFRVLLDRGDGQPQGATILGSARLELRRTVMEGRGADYLAGRESPQAPLSHSGLDALGERHHDLVDRLDRADQDVTSLEIDPLAKPHQVEEAATGQWKECQIVELRLVGRELDRPALQPQPPDMVAVDRHEDDCPAYRLP